MGRKAGKPAPREAYKAKGASESMARPPAQQRAMVPLTFRWSRWTTLLAAGLIVLTTLAAYQNCFRVPLHVRRPDVDFGESNDSEPLADLENLLSAQH